MGPNGENLFPKEKGGKPQVAIAVYEKNLDKLVVRLNKTGAKLIWRNTTPVPPGAKGRYVGDSIKYNPAAARVMKKHDVPTHDLFTMSKLASLIVMGVTALLPAIRRAGAPAGGSSHSAFLRSSSRSARHSRYAISAPLKQKPG